MVSDDLAVLLFCDYTSSVLLWSGLWLVLLQAHVTVPIILWLYHFCIVMKWFIGWYYSKCIQLYHYLVIVPLLYCYEVVCCLVLVQVHTTVLFSHDCTTFVLLWSGLLVGITPGTCNCTHYFVIVPLLYFVMKWFVGWY